MNSTRIEISSSGTSDSAASSTVDIMAMPIDGMTPILKRLPGRGAQVIDRLRGDVEAAQQVLDVRDIDRARLGELDAARMAPEQEQAELFLELLDLHAERRLGDVERPGRGGEAAVLGHLAEIAELPQLHRPEPVALRRMRGGPTSPRP